MIKLIASDLDGTLLPPKKGVPEETFDIIKKLKSKGITFVAASGRQLPNLKKMFAPVLDDIGIIAENGGLVYIDGKIIYENPTPADGVLRALAVLEGISGLYPLLSCADCAYYGSDNIKFIETVNRSYSSAQKCENLKEEAKKHTVLKISVWDEESPSANHGGIILPPLLGGLRTIVSGCDWLDVSAANANKGEALKAIYSYLNVEKDECEAYGDHMNDWEMLLVCGHAYVTENAFAGLKEKIPGRIPSNADLGVIKKMRGFL